ncbi:MAG: hypothetical protein BWY76_03449 [bacterium ADurb.Bin429]|nr:MAG: hypothetical protein BWY76_03449 [bacterium ADurb.Bin429]
MTDREMSPEELKAQRLHALEEVDRFRKSHPPSSEEETVRM